MNFFKNNVSGSVLVIVVICVSLFAAIAFDLASRYTASANFNRKFKISAENVRIADELAKVVAKAYEYGKQSGSVCPSTTQGFTAGSPAVAFCFAQSSGGASHHPANCVATKLNSAGQVCIDLSGPKIVASLKGQLRYILKTNSGTLQATSPENLLLNLFFEPAFADETTFGKPPEPTGVSNSAPNTYQCDASSTYSVCRRCGPGASNICFQVEFCPADKDSCTASERLKFDLMVYRN